MMAVPRPANWEVPDLKNEGNYFQLLPTLYSQLPRRLLTTLRSTTITHRPRVENFLRRRVRFNNRQDWTAHSLLGEGGFGISGLWIKRDQVGRIVDELVVKEQRDRPGGQSTNLRYTELGAGPFRGVLKEAVIQKQMNEYYCENILHLRGYKYMSNVHLPHDPANGPPAALPLLDMGQYRFYLEYAPFQTLDQLINRYRAWDQLIPEAFLWHVFDSLAAALQTLAKAPDRKFSSRGWSRRTVNFWPTDHEVVHFDIKPDNIFLGYEDWKDHSQEKTGGSALFRWPVIKLADFGHGEITGPSDPRNVIDNYWKGAGTRKAPESQFLGVDWNPPFNHTNRFGQQPNRNAYEAAERANPSFSYGSHTDVFCVGHVMYDLMTLSHHGDLDAIIQLQFTEPRYQVPLQRFLVAPNQQRRLPFATAMRHNIPPVFVNQNTYSNELVNLIFHCLRPSIAERIPIDHLRRRTQAGLARCERAAFTNPPTRVRRKPIRRARRTPISRVNVTTPNVRYRNIDFNNMAQGTSRYIPVADDYRRLMERTFIDDNEPNLALPLPKWTAEINTHGNPYPLHQHNYQIVNGQIRFGAVGGAGGGAGGAGGIPGGGGA